MEKIRNLSIRKTIVLYMTVNLLLSFLLSAVIINAAKMVQWRINDKYVQEMEIENFTGLAKTELMTPEDAFIVSTVCDFLITWSILLITVPGSILAVFLFYRNKIKRPLLELRFGTSRIAQNELDFRMEYVNKDELGELCAQFERMRGQLEENNKILWKTIEQEKALRAAVAHDICSPLAVMRGYQEMLLEFIPEKTLDQEQELNMLRCGMEQIERLEKFIETMRNLSKLEDRPIQYQELEWRPFLEKLESDSALLAQRAGKSFTFTTDIREGKTRFDPELVREVLDNLLSNALRYAARTVRTDVTVRDGALWLSVRDDGTGFEASGEQAVKALYHSNPQDDQNHFGLGLYLSRIFCEKHGGNLLIGNQESGGGEVKACFRIKDRA